MALPPVDDSLPLAGIRQINGIPVQVLFTDFEGGEIASNNGSFKALPAGAVARPLLKSKVCPEAAPANERNTMTLPASIEQARFNMIEQQIRPWDVLDPKVLELLSVVKREDFVPEAHKALAFVDMEIPLAGGAEQAQADGRCMLAPRVEARLLQEAAPQPHETVLEIGAGSGYMAALLAGRAQSVVSLEIDPQLAAQARANLKELGWTTNEWTLGAWWRDVDGGFSIARHSLGYDIREQGFEFAAELLLRRGVEPGDGRGGLRTLVGDAIERGLTAAAADGDVHVAVLRTDHGVGDGEHGRCVDDDPVEPAAQPVHQLVRARAVDLALFAALGVATCGFSL